MMEKKAKYYTDIGPEGETRIRRTSDGKIVGNCQNGVAKVWKRLFEIHDGFAFDDELWNLMITKENHTIHIKQVPDITNYEISVEKAKQIVKRNWVGPNSAEPNIFQHLLLQADLKPVTIGLYESKAHS